jgi:hypothetical protein
MQAEFHALRRGTSKPHLRQSDASEVDNPADVPSTPAPGDDNVSPPASTAESESEPLEAAAGPMPRRPERVGVLVVHGIGEQRRFEHLEEQTKKIAKAIQKREERTGQPTKVTFEILPAPGGAPYQSEHDSWMGGRFPAVRALVRHGDHLEHETHLHFHEVWWADANERPTFAKQIRFWGWGLAMWSIPSKSNSKVAGFGSMVSPTFPDNRPGKPGNLPGNRKVRLLLFNRLQLFLTGWIFLLSSFSVTLAVFLLKRLNFGVWSPVNTFVNYVSGVKLYTQSHRSGGGPLEGISEPPRFTIRRRMVRALVDVATADYDRWYVLAHSLGTVVAFNGLMTHAHSIPNYLDERRWRRLRLRPGWVGQPRSGMHETIEGGKFEIPPRPIWISDDQVVVYRERLYGKFRGLLTYGSPLDKFAGMWPAYVTINRDVQVFSQDTKWINIFDRTDPVAAALKAYHDVGLLPVNCGYKASIWLLLGHLKYLDLHDDATRKGKEPADCVVEWLLRERFVPPAADNAAATKDIPQLYGSAGWYQAGDRTSLRRVLAAYLQWAVVLAVLTLLGVWVLRWLLHLSGWSFNSFDWPLSWLLGFLDVGSACGNDCTGVFKTMLAVRPTLAHALALAVCGAGFTAVIGILGCFVREDDDDPGNW